MYDPIGKYDLFINHASVDSEVARTIASRLEPEGVKCWFSPRDMGPGMVYADSIYYAIERAPVFAVLMSRAANDSRHVVRELELADQMDKRVVPVRLENFEATGAFCYYTRAAHFYPWHEAPDEVLRRISEQVEQARESGNLSKKRSPTPRPKRTPRG